ncbi:2-C-methyl-D-erythritol 4-phosphate cytidylyltransferase [Paenilisteria rocourtiae]|uniref:2-C-methyl-D-erythritol 4-phosphate cytidylyltransferase n=1 Tax=Listeria rocourtiae TaxID=647910 RepID=A0A4R6ZIG7_9LIST|nr:2-C-methyl-D-erythritol 4-phosphate cytidylyltransferase [Listeria rocourtiae]EUJ47297.1 2-C-methyl-D-erythritol 4-phosphate cytidylyltransferase [Listeria rocourtiae FSL F6-920]MBC1434066.1 2-C-methyl-D-erythritol 4-phosphate cytidylyltransferase [Listeria rocourtiae]MBC1605148.1 2-C-methyl-D-erythritol 4-phosphate cytidylyltransferase [Listeria rocourtiae]TDR52121.1 2-C-methyl-D-erythritol 4-phosphate cytidylyltransferase [Listeria rocourtiae]
MKYELILLAAGQGKRMELGRNKMWLELSGNVLFLHTIRTFLEDDACCRIVVVVKEDELDYVRAMVDALHVQKEILIVMGGSERQYSVAKGLAECGQLADVVLVHDGARPFVDQSMINRLLSGVAAHGATICGMPVKDTMKRVRDGMIEETIDRSVLWQVQTPQAFRTEILKQAHEIAAAAEFLGTDEASLVERLGMTVHMVEGSYNNIKVTTPEDIAFAEAILQEKWRNRV